MKYVDKLLQETEFLQLLNKLEGLEQKRKFCRHGLEHLLDTARIAWIQVLEQERNEAGIRPRPDMPDKETIYLAALLHDLGRIREYEDGIPHQEAGAVLTLQLLGQIGYPKEKAEVIRQAVVGHRGNPAADAAGGLRELLVWADKKSRNCFFCKVQNACKWEQEKRNDTIDY